MRLLLDTQALLWALATPAKLPAPTARAIRDPANAVFISSASAWEIAIKVVAHAVRVRSLPAHHRDPFDRMLVAQAVEEGLSVV